MQAKRSKINVRFWAGSLGSVLAIVGWVPITTSQPASTPKPAFRVVVNSNQDQIQPDQGLTLREAIALVNGTLSLESLSAAEKAQVEALEGAASARIEFNLPSGQTVIRLTEVLPPLDRPGLILDGTTQPGYDANQSATAEIAIPIPIVEITAAEGTEVFRGLTVTADGVTVRGLSLYGFSSIPRVTASTPPADILIAHRLPPPDISQQKNPASTFSFSDRDIPPKDVVIENNWLGLRPDETVPATTSAFGVSVFNSRGTTIRRNRISAHDGSGIITGVRAENLQINENILVGNGIAGMPDAIRLEGVITQAQITANLICGNDGSAVYLFKPQGSVQIRDNQMAYNGRRLRRAAVYLMGNDHQVVGNLITHQTGPGVVVAAYPESVRNLIQNNQFAALEGLSIDLVTQQNTDVQHYQRGDGPNPRRDTSNRRKHSGNAAINAPELASSQFFALASGVTLLGTGDRGSEIQIYRVADVTSTLPYGTLRQLLATVPTDEQGRFSVNLTGLQPGDQVSAIASHAKFGTSEPTIPSLIQLVGTSVAAPANPEQARGEVPRCTTPPQPAPAPAPVAETPTAPIRLQVPKNIHFALDKDAISPATASVLNRIAQVLQSNPTIVVEIQGHTDPRASDAYNLELGNRRAKAARNYLLRRGIVPERMTIRSFGERQPISTGTSRLDYARDRRVEFIYKDAQGIEVIVQAEDLQVEP